MAVPMMPGSRQGAAEVVVAHGARAVEELLLRQLEEMLPTSPEELLHPVRVVVPSRSLRLHLSQTLVRRFGAVAGILVQTLHRVACEIVERAHERPPRGRGAFHLLVRKVAGDEALLRDALEDLEDGYGSVAATVRDLLDAGFEPAHEDATLEKLDDLRAGPVAGPVLERAQAVVRVAARVCRASDELGVGSSAALLRRAAELLAQDPDGLLPSRMIVVHGFADATGLAVDLIQALMRHCRARVLLDRPPDAAKPTVEDLGASFSDRFRDRLAGVAPVLESEAGFGRAPRLELVAAPDREAEVRVVTERIRRLLISGTRPEAVAVVARDLQTYSSTLRCHFDRLGVPCSGVGTRVAAPLAVRCRALVALLASGGQTPVEQWLQALAPSGLSGDVLTGLRSLGLGLLADVARLEVADLNDVPIPVLVGWRDGRGDADDEGRARRRRLPREELELWWRRARAAVEVFDTWPATATAEAHLNHSLELLESMAWDEKPLWLDTVRRALAEEAADQPAGWDLERPEWVLLARRRLEGEGRVPLGGQGGGVQLLTVTEARARTFGALFVLGLNRDVFPRVIREDALLPDTVRTRLVEVLDDMPVKERGWDEERYLLAQLLSAAEEVVLSWHRSAGGKEVAPSPVLSRLRTVDSVSIEDVPAAWATGDDRGGVRPAFEHSVLTGLTGDRKRWDGTLARALSEGRQRCGVAMSASTAQRVARARRELLEELDPVRPCHDLGPLTGCIGSIADKDPRRRRLAVTLLEGMARCPWQVLVSRLLGVGRAPDPLFELPTADPLLVGSVVHQVLETVVVRVIESGGDVAEAIERGPAEVPWPAVAELEGMIEEAARDVARREGLGHVGIDRVLVELVWPYLEMARRADWPAGVAPQVLGSEVWGTAHVEDARVDLVFRADRVDRDQDGLLFTDYKTGKPMSQKGLLKSVARGTSLQAAAYCAGARGEPSRGRYLYLKPDPESPQEAGAEIAIDSSQAEPARHFAEAVAVLMEAWRRGAFVPRLTEWEKDREAPWCRYCEVEEACLRGDSGFRRRLLQWRAGGPPDDPVVRAAWRLWWLGSKRGGEVPVAGRDGEP
jgi:superfamily I DNA/RNA helicase